MRSLLLALLMILPTLVLANESGFVLRGELNSYFKNQNNYKSALDTGTDSSIRSGANNRIDQNARTRLKLEIIPYGGKLNIPGNPKTREWIGYARLEFDANDPDKNTANDDLGQSLDIKNAWWRYSPAPMIGFKVGRMSIVPTINARLTYEFRADIDQDFILYAAGGLVNKDGFEIDMWLADGVSVGVAELQGMSRGGRIATNGASSTRAKTRVVWTKIERPGYALQFARQYVNSSQTYPDESRRYIHRHIAQNWAAQLRVFPKFQPFVGSQTFWGEKTYRPFAAGDIASAVGLTGLSTTASCLMNEHGRGEYDAKTIGFVSKLGNGGLAFEKTQFDTASYCSPNSITPNVELDIHSQTEAWYRPAKNIKVYTFYYYSQHKKDAKLRNDIAAYKNDIATLSALPVDTSAVTGPLTAYAAALEQQTYTDTASRGLGVVISF